MSRYKHDMTCSEAAVILRNAKGLPAEVREAVDVVLEKAAREERLNHKDSPYPFNLLLDAFGDASNEAKILDRDQLAGLEHVLSELKETNPDVALALDMYYRQGAGFNEIGRRLGVAGPTARMNYIVKGLRFIRHPSKSQYIKKGYQVFSGELYEKEYNRHLEEIQRARDAAERKTREHGEPENEAEPDPDKATETEPASAKRGTSIADLELSVRAHNVLYRSQIWTVGDILALNAEHIVKIRHMGTRTAKEVFIKLHELGFDRFDDGSEIP